MFFLCVLYFYVFFIIMIIISMIIIYFFPDVLPSVAISSFLSLLTYVLLFLSFFPSLII